MLRPSNPDRVLSVSSVRREGPAWSRMRRAFALPFHLSPEGRDFVACLLAVPGVIIVAIVLAMMLAPIWQGVPA
jgi:hypothetical protein